MKFYLSESQQIFTNFSYTANGQDGGVKYTYAPKTNAEHLIE